MKLLVLQPYGDGAGHFARYTLRICEQLARAGHDVTLVVNTIDTTPYLDGPPSFRIVALGPGYEFFPYEQRRLEAKLYWMSARMRLNLAVLRRGATLCREERFDAVQIFGTEFVSLWLGSSLIWRGRMPPLVLEIAAANFSPDQYYGSLVDRVWRRLMRVAMLRLTRGRLRAINVNSASHAPALRQQLRLPESFPIEIVSDTREIPAESIPKRDARNRVGLDGFDGPVFLFFGTWRRDKGIDTLVRALSLLAARDCRVVIAGMPLDWDFGPEHEGLLRDPRIVVHRRYIAEQDVNAYFYAADALVLPYPGYYSASSGPLYDACARGLPVIASEVSEMGRIVGERGNGLLVEPDSPRALADAMTRFAELDADERRRMGDRALAIAQGNTRADVAARFATLYQRVAGRG